jgi:hypothetical protein
MMDVREGIGGETAIKLMHKEIGICSRYRVQTRKNVYLWTKLDMTHQTIGCGGWHYQ